MEEGATNPGDNAQHHAYDLHGVGQPTEGQKYISDDLDLGINHINAGLSRYNGVAIPSFPIGASEQATTAFYANNSFNLGTDGPSNHGHNNAGYIGHALGNVTAPVSVYDQASDAAFPPQYDNGGYLDRYPNRNIYPSATPNVTTTFGMTHGSSGYVNDSNAFDAPSTGTNTTRRGILPASIPGFIGDQFSQYGDNVFPAGHANRNLSPSNNANAMALGMGHDIGGYATGGGTLGAPSTGMTFNLSSSLSSPTPGSVGDQYSHYGDDVHLAGHANRNLFRRMNNASGRAFEMTHGSSGYVNNGNALGAPFLGNTATMGSSLSPSTLSNLDSHDVYYSDGVDGTPYPNVNPNPSNNVLPLDTGTAYGSSSNVSSGTAFDVPPTGATTTMSGTMQGSTFGPVASGYLQHSDGFDPTGYSTASPTDVGKAPRSNSHTTNDTTTGTAHGSSVNAAANDPALAAHPPRNPPTLRGTFSPSASGPVTGPDGRPRWPCTTCSATLSRQSDMVRHAKKHGDERPYQCLAPGCTYNSYRSDRLAQHKLNKGH